MEFEILRFDVVCMIFKVANASSNNGSSLVYEWCWILKWARTVCLVPSLLTGAVSKGRLHLFFF